MSGSFYSKDWHRVEHLKPRLRSSAILHRHQYRGRTWYVLQDRTSGQFQRFAPEAFQIIARMDGERTLGELWELACDQLGDEMPSQDEMIAVVSALFRANALIMATMPDIAGLRHQHQTTRRNQWLQRVKSPLGIRIPLFDPENFLTATNGLARLLFSRWGAMLWCLVVGIGGVQALLHWPALSNNLSDQLLSLESVLLMVLVYPFVKTLHELGHAWAVKRWGGEVHEIGIMLLVFFPVPYVDASAATAFASKYQRMAVGAAGILVEVFIAAIAMVVWSLAEPGLVRAVAWNTMLIAGISTVLFNGNPLLRFDAYYVLADWLEIPNLGTRSNRYLGYLCKRYLFGLAHLPSPADSLREKIWLVFYSIASFVYRIVVMLAIALYVAGSYFLVGVILALWAVYSGVIAPALKVMILPFTAPDLMAVQKRILLTGGICLLACVALLAAVPMPYATYSQGVLWVPENTLVRATEDGFLKTPMLPSGEQVSEGQPVIQMDDAEVAAELSLAVHRLQEAESRYRASVSDAARAAIRREVVRYRQQEVDTAREHHDRLIILSPSAGTVIIPDSDNLTGRYVRRGQMLGYVVDYNTLPVMAMIAEDNIGDVKNRTRNIEVRLASLQEKSYSATIERVYPASIRSLPSEVLTVEGGGRIARDPGSLEGALQAFRPYFWVQLNVPELPRERLNERVHIVFQHPPEPLVLRFYRGIRRVFLRQLDV
ncbi:MAG: efflux RND transporter periplasmic adaptor subunit [Endozoicomonas sp.]